MIFRLLASTRLAALLLLGLAAILAATTLVESKYDTRTAQALVYQSRWFFLYLVALAVNVLCSLISRLPYTWRQLGFGLTHVGILALMAGAGLTRAQGMEGTLSVAEGDSGSLVTLDRYVLCYGRSQRDLREVPVELRVFPPSPSRPYFFPLVGGVQARVDGYLHHAEERQEQVEDSNGPPAVLLRLHGPQLDAQRWLTLGQTRQTLGPAVVHFHLAQDRQDAEVVLSRIVSSQGSVAVQVGNVTAEIPVETLLSHDVALGASGVTAHVQKAYARLQVSKGVRSDGERGPDNPAVELVLADGAGNSQKWLLYGVMAQFNRLMEEKGKLPGPVSASYEFGLAPPGTRRLQVALAGQELVVHLDGGKSVTLSPGQEVDTGWPDIKLQYVRGLTHARSQRTMVETGARSSLGTEIPAAIHLTLEGSRDPGPYWVRADEWLKASTMFGEPLLLMLRRELTQLPFSVKLTRFTIDRDPATGQPANFRSEVEISGANHSIALNQPARALGFNFLQQSYQTVPNEPSLSILTVSRDPGLALKYAGCGLLLAGALVTLLSLAPPAPGPPQEARP